MAMLEWQRRLLGDRLVVGGITFGIVGIADRPASTADFFNVRKYRPMIDTLAELVQRLQPRRIVEIGIDEGGSTVLLNELAQPERLAAIEYDTQARPALDEYVAGHPNVDVYLGVDQADRTAVANIAATFDGALDLVVDDASHTYAETVASFEVLFPLLRPGGVYVIEDWNWSLVPFKDGNAPPGPSIVPLVERLIHGCGKNDGTIASVAVEHLLCQVVRGPAPIDSFTVG